MTRKTTNKHRRRKEKKERKATISKTINDTVVGRGAEREYKDKNKWEREVVQRVEMDALYAGRCVSILCTACPQCRFTSRP